MTAWSGRQFAASRSRGRQRVRPAPLREAVRSGVPEVPTPRHGGSPDGSHLVETLPSHAYSSPAPIPVIPRGGSWRSANRPALGAARSGVLLLGLGDASASRSSSVRRRDPTGSPSRRASPSSATGSRDLSFCSAVRLFSSATPCSRRAREFLHRQLERRLQGFSTIPRIVPCPCAPAAPGGGSACTLAARVSADRIALPPADARRVLRETHDRSRASTARLAALCVRIPRGTLAPRSCDSGRRKTEDRDDATPPQPGLARWPSTRSSSSRRRRRRGEIRPSGMPMARRHGLRALEPLLRFDPQPPTGPTATGSSSRPPRSMLLYALLHLSATPHLGRPEAVRQWRADAGPSEYGCAPGRDHHRPARAGLATGVAWPSRRR